MGHITFFTIIFLFLGCFHLQAATNEELSQIIDELEKRQEEIFLLGVENNSPVKSCLNDNSSATTLGFSILGKEKNRNLELTKDE